MAKSTTPRKKNIETPSYRREVTYFLLKFFVLMGLLFFVELFNPVHQKVIIPFTGLIARASVFLLTLLGTGAKSAGTVIFTTKFSVDIKAGCNGIEPIIILLAAIFAFPSSWRAKFYGAFLGVIILQLINLIRVVSLVFIGISYPKFFNEAHTFIWQILIISLSLFLWMIWAKGLKKYEAKAA